ELDATPLDLFSPICHSSAEPSPTRITRAIDDLRVCEKSGLNLEIAGRCTQKLVGTDSLILASQWAWKENPNGAFVNWHPHVSCKAFNAPSNF
ncbi:MAG: hypothetical protein WCE73_04880, partial [Candidatus Angelobacter sp.]